MRAATAPLLSTTVIAMVTVTDNIRELLPTRGTHATMVGAATTIVMSLWSSGKCRKVVSGWNVQGGA